MLLFAVVRAQSQGILPLKLRTGGWPRNLLFFLWVLLKVQLHNVLQQQPVCCAVCLAHVIFRSLCSFLPCMSLWVERCTGALEERVGAAVHWVDSCFSRLMDPAVSVLP